MSQTIKLKRGTTTPTTSNIVSGEVAIDTSAKKLYVNDAGTIKEIGGTGTLSASDIPNLPASKITSGTFGASRIPNLNASKITAGTLSSSRIPSLDASKITSGTLADARIPNLNGSKITSGFINSARIPQFLEEKYIYNSNDSNGVFMPMVKGGMYATTASTVTGGIKVVLPAYKSNMMFTIYVDIFEYTSGETCTFRVSGYAYNDSGATWHNCSVVAITDNNRDYTVRFYSDTANSQQYFTIGETNSTWSYPQVTLRDFWGGYSTSEAEAQGTWNISFATSFSGTLRHTFSDNLPYADWDRLEGKPSFATVATSGSYNDLSNKPSIPSAANNGTMTITAGTALTGGGSFTANQSGNTSVTINHGDTSSQGSVNNSGNTVIQDITLDTHGHITGITSKALSIPSAANNATITINAGTNLTGGGNFTTNQGSNETITINHEDVSSQGSVNNSNGTVIQDVSLNANGHVTSLGSVNLDNRYVLNTGDSLTGAYTLGQNSVGTTYGNSVSTVPPNRIQQTVGDNDGWRLYGEAPSSNDVKMIFEIIDDIEGGDTWVFRNKKTYSPYTAHEEFKIAGGGAIYSRGNYYPNGQTSNYVSSGRIANWQTAYGWGNHASQGYYTSSTTIPYSQLSGTPSIPSAPANATITLSAGTGLSGGGNFTTNQSSAETLTFNLTTPANAPSSWNDVVAWSGGLVKDTAVEIHGSGYLRASYLNMTHGVGTRSSDTVFYSSTDDYIRKTNSTGMRAALNVPTRTGGDASGTWGINITGNAATATRWATSRTLSLTGDVTGSASFNGSANASITCTIADDSHNHTIANVDGLQTSLNSKYGSGSTIVAAAGTGAAPGVTFSGDTNLGLYRYGADVMAVTAGGTRRARFGSTIYLESNDVRINSYLYHNGDTNTHLRFENDRIIMKAGNVEMLDMVEGATDYVDIIDRVRVTSGGNLECEGNITAYSTTSISDINQKENIQLIDSPIEKIKQISGYTFDWKNSGESSGGVIAQEIEEIMPSIIKEVSIRDSETMKSVDYQAIIGLLVETVKDLNNRIEELEANNE